MTKILKQRFVETDEYIFNLEGKFRQVNKLILVKPISLNTNVKSVTLRFRTTHPVIQDTSLKEHQNIFVKFPSSSYK